MKIAFVSVFYPYRGGIAQFNAALYQSLLAKGHETKAFNFSLQYPNLLFPGKTQYVTNEDDAEKIPSIRSINSISPFSYAKTVHQIKQYEPDLVIIGYWMPFMAPSLGYIGKKMRRFSKVLAIVHNATPHEQSKLDNLLSNYFFRSVQNFVALSANVAKEIQVKYPEKNVIALPHPIYQHFGKRKTSVDAKNELNLALDKKYLLFFGLIRPYKGLMQLLEAMALLPEHFHLIVAGESYEDFSKYEQKINAYQIEHRIHLHIRYIPDHEVSTFFSASDCCVLPYTSATQSGIIAIARQFEVPVISTNVGGLSEFIQDQKEGFLVSPNSPSELAKAIEASLKNGQIEKMRAAIRERNHTFSWQFFTEEILKFAKHSV
ncbi:MAG: glycosyltransferase [Crocinitomicaceae bacterium]|nr:glycosyltransferase [Crocinitomicaceae bacterium]